MRRVRSLLAMVLLAGTALMSATSYAQFAENSCIVTRGGNSCTANEGGAITATPVACDQLTQAERDANTNGCKTPATPSCKAGDTVPIQILVGLAPSNADRYDVGVYVSTDQNKPLNVAAPTGAATCAATAVLIPPGTAIDPNTCGDQPAKSAIADSIPLNTSIVCTAGTGGLLAIQIGASYQQNVGTTTSCSYPGATQVSPGTGSKCNTNALTVPINVITPSASVQLIKHLVPGNNSGLFNLSIASNTPADPTSTVTDVTEGGSVTRTGITSGTVVTLSETAGTGTSLNGYTSGLACVRTDNQQSVTVTNNTITMPTPEVGIVCTFTNTLNSATVTVNKDFIPNNAATVPVALSCTSGTVTTTPLNASEAAAAVFTVTGFTPGATCTATETVPAGYTANQTGCVGVAVGGSCTITNTLNTSTITVNKDFIPNSGASVSVALSCSSGSVAQTPLNASEAAAAVFTVNGASPGTTCTATETVPAGYTANQAGCIGVALGGSCTITNTLRSGTITVFKDFSDNNSTSVPVALSCGSGSVTQTPLSASEAAAAVFTVTGFNPGATCTATETVPAGYTADQANCQGVSIGGSCTITNTLVVVPKDVPVPTLSTWVLMLLGLMLAGSAWVAVRRR